MRERWIVRAGAGAVAAVLIAAAFGEFPLLPALAIAALAAVLLAAEAFIAVKHHAAQGPPPARPAVREGLVDTSALIDGRLGGIVETGFVSFDIVVPAFVLRELQHVADAGDPMRRARGRRGLDVLQALRASRQARVRVIEDDVPELGEVDAKLLELAVRRGAALVTTDFNLNKVATIRGVVVLNVNDLAHALRPVILPGESLRLAIVKEGKEPGQGVGYLEDGTMVVVDQGRTLVGKTATVSVTSTIQTAAGKMFFARPVPGE